MYRARLPAAHVILAVDVNSASISTHKAQLENVCICNVCVATEIVY